MLCCAVFVAVTCLSAGQEEVMLKRLVKAPDSIEESFYRFDKNVAEINGAVIQDISLNYVAGKSGGQIKIQYKNHTQMEVVPGCLVRLYNPFGVCMGGVWVSGENMNAHDPIAPGDSGVTIHRFSVFRMEAYIRHGLKGKLPADFADLAWVSISKSNTLLAGKPKKRIRKFELLNEQ